jgi:F-type H+-transporting ATPase subunit delta
MHNISRRELASYAAEQLLDQAKPSEIARELAAILVISRRVNQAELLAEDIGWELERRGRAANATVISAHELSEQLRKSIVAHVKKAADVKEVIINETVDPSILGGVRIDTAAHSWDKSLRRKLTEIKEVF